MIGFASGSNALDVGSRRPVDGRPEASNPAPGRGSLPAVTELQAVAGLAVFWVCVDSGRAWIIAPVPLALLGVPAIAAVTAARRRRSVAPLVMTVAALGLVVGGWAADGYRELPTTRFSQLAATLASDPRPLGTGWRATVSVVGAGQERSTAPASSSAASSPTARWPVGNVPDGARVEVVAYGRAGFVLQSAAVGERLVLAGSARPVGDRPWLRARHVVARASVEEVEVVAPAGVLYRVAESVRELIGGGGAGFDPPRQALYTGLVIGDDRFQPLSQQARFRVAGLSHLLAVSGQNVTFVLLVVWPAVRLLPYRWRFVAIGLALILFVVVTRAEPSVLRATACAGLATWAHLTGRDRSGIRVLVGGVAALLILDPFLVDVVGFQLSVGASAGILVLAPVIVDRVGVGSVVLSRLLVQPLAVTVAAQLGVAPLLVHYFGPMSLVALPANLLAGWAAGAIMTLGLTTGPLAGLLNRSEEHSVATVVADIVQTPTELLLWWIESVAAHSVRLPLPQFDGLRLALLVGLSGLVAIRSRRFSAEASITDSTGGGMVPAAQMLGSIPVLVASIGLVLVIAGAVPTQPRDPAQLAPDCLWIRRARLDTGEWASIPVPSLQPDSSVPSNESLPQGSLSVLVVGADCSRDVVDIVIRLRLRSIDVVVTERGDGQAGVITSALTEVVDVAVVLAPPLHRIKPATRLTETASITGPAGLDLVIEPTATRTALVVRPAPVDGRLDGEG